MAKELTVFEKLKIPYVEKDGLFYPVLDDGDVQTKEESQKSVLSDDLFPGKYGLLWLDYMQENQKDRYRNLIRFGRAAEKAVEVNEEAYDMLEVIMKQYLNRHRPRDSNSTIEMWKIREEAKAVAEETVLRDIVYHYH